MLTTIQALTRYPVKGMSGQLLEEVKLSTAQGFPCDRQYGFARPDSGFDPQNPKPLSKKKFYMLARDARLALLKTEFSDENGLLSMLSPEQHSQFDITTVEGKQNAALFLKTFLALPEDETPQLFEASPHRFTDVSVISTEMMNAVSIVNQDSVLDFSETIGKAVDPERFRANILISGLPSFTELEMIGQTMSIGSAQLKLVKRTQRCPATEVDLLTGGRDIETPKLLRKHYGHMNMGVYAEVLKGGVITKGDSIKFDT